MYFFKIANTILNILQWIAGALLFHHFIFGILGIFTRKTFPKTQEKLKYGVIIPARNEEEVVGQLIESVKNNNYPTEKLHVFVIAHNCTDKTAEVARNLGATVYEYNNPEECTMGYAFRYLFKKIKEDYGIENYDGFFLFNADNVLDENFFSRMNDAFVAEDRKSVITSYRNSKNFGANAISACYGLYFILGSALESRGRTSVGCSTRVHGTGYVIPPEIVKDGWNYVTLTEDWEFTSDRIMNDTKIVYCDDAIFYDE
ncbi:MAG: glycosyltransferase, partial [Clostridia bacterium]|nr:glycosyltransferase [Clostridia bacterium]